jgi:GTPase-associated protein 1, N-terminal domain type 2
MIEREIPIEQLWYTWSEVGLGTIRAGFRIRAASEGLSDVQSERVKCLDRYVRYLLPPGTDHFAVTPEQAPRCLAITQTEQNETIIVHKQYTGRDGVGRPGNFFTHLLALGGNSGAFSAADAIWLWGSGLWQMSDAGLDQRVTTLNRLSLDTLYAQRSFRPQFVMVETFLPFLIEAYLTRREAYPIYILTPTDAPALLPSMIAGLVRCLPRSLLAGLSFSTYEPDHSRATTQLVGLSADLSDANAGPVVPASFYQERLALNCVTGERSSLARHPLTQASRQATQFAREATRCLVTDDMEQMDALLDRIENTQDFTADKFLRFYSHSFGSADDITPKDIEEYISGPEGVQWLNAGRFREHIIAAAIQDPRWGSSRLCRILSTHLASCEKTWQRIASTQGQAALRAFLTAPQGRIGPKTSAQVPRQRSEAGKRTLGTQNDLQLLSALSQLAKDAVAIIKPTLKKMGRRADQGEESSNDNSVVAVLLELMDACLFSSDIYGIWKALLEEIVANREMQIGLMRNWTLHTTLLQQWSSALPATTENDALISPLLRVTWSVLGDFLLLHLDKQHQAWNVIALEKLLNSASSLSASRAQRLAQIAAPEVLALLEQLIEEPPRWPLAVGMVTVLVRQGYPGSQAYIDLLEKFFEKLVQASQDWELARDLLIALTQSGSGGTKRYRNRVNRFLQSLLNTASLEAEGFKLVEALVKYGYPGKAELVPLLLETPRYQHDLLRVLTTVYSTDEELATFFVQQGKDYLVTQQQVDFMLNLYDRLKVQPGRQQRLWVLLNAPLEEATVIRLLKTIALEDEVLVPILQRYGARYLQGYQDCPQLAAWVVQTFSDLAARGYLVRDLFFVLFTQPADPSHLETLLARSANLLSLPDIRKFLNAYGTNPAYISFCCRSATMLMLLEQYAKQIVMQPKKGAQLLSQEKMQMLALWLEPQRVSEMQLTYSEIEAILTAVHLQVVEQVQFLVHYGDFYLHYTQDLPHLQEYVRNYVASLTVDAFEQPEQCAVFNAVCQDPALDTDTRYRLAYWQRVLGFFEHPATDAQTLTDLGEALNHLPINKAMMTKLAQASVLCIKEERDLMDLAYIIQQLPEMSYEQMLYGIAEQAAVMYNQYRSEGPLIPYITFVLTCNLAGYERFVKMFLDALFRPIAESDLDTWSLLHLWIEAPQAQPLPPQALERWYVYLNGRGLLHKIQKNVQKQHGRTGSTGPRRVPTGGLDGESGQGGLWRRLWGGRKRSQG